MRRLVLALAILSSLPSAGFGAPPNAPMSGDLPEHRAADPDAAPITAANLMASEAFWPYQVKMTRDWKPAGEAGRGLRKGDQGVLVWVESSEVERVDFGRHGVYDVPVAATDLVARANGVRKGEVEKLGYNQTRSMGPRLVNARAPRLAPIPYSALVGKRAYLSVFADPQAEGFASLAAALAAHFERPDVEVVLFPQGGHPDEEVLERLHAVGWKGSFSQSRLTPSYTRSFLKQGDAPPFVLLQTNEGRVLFRGPWSGDTVAPKLASALEGALGAPPPPEKTAGLEPAPKP